MEFGSFRCQEVSVPKIDTEQNIILKKFRYVIAFEIACIEGFTVVSLSICVMLCV